MTDFEKLKIFDWVIPDPFKLVKLSQSGFSIYTKPNGDQYCEVVYLACSCCKNNLKNKPIFLIELLPSKNYEITQSFNQGPTYPATGLHSYEIGAAGDFQKRDTDINTKCIGEYQREGRFLIYKPSEK